MNLNTQYVKRGASGRIKHPVPVFKAKTNSNGIKAVFAVCIGFGCFVFFVGFSTGLFVLFNVLAHGGI